MKKIMARGRVLGSHNSEFAKMLKDEGQSRVFTLKSGKQAKFESVSILSGDIESRTFVDPDINGRDQSLLTPDSLSDISRTIKLQQFFPAIGREINGKIEILDGSRRRASCILNHVKFDILVTRDDIDVQDAKQLAKDIQTAREHSLRELGKRFVQLGNGGLTNEQIARSENVSPSKVTRALQAASVPDEIISVFPLASDLSHADYLTLLKLIGKARQADISINELAEDVRQQVISIKSDERLDKTLILTFFRNACSGGKVKRDKRVETEQLRNFAGHNQFARKKVDAQKRLVVYEFSRMSADVQSQIDAAVKRIIDEAEDD